MSLVAERDEASEYVGMFQCELPVCMNILRNNNIATRVSFFFFLFLGPVNSLFSAESPS